MAKFCDLKGLKFNELTVVELAGKDVYGKLLWKCKCSCGNEVVTHGRSLVNGHCKSCGCLRNKKKKQEAIYKGLCDTRLFRIWKGMRYRCNNQNNQNYANYGARGISVCEEWDKDGDGFFNFLKWGIENGYSDKLSIDRIDNDGNYCPENCRWVDWDTQASNRRKPKKIVNQYGVWDYKQPLPEPYKENADD